MSPGWRVAGLLVVSGVIFIVQLLLFSPFRSYHGQLHQQTRDNPSLMEGDAEIISKLMSDLHSAPNRTTFGDQKQLSEVINKVGLTEFDQDDEVSFAPIIIGAGQGTTGTHLFAEATCKLGFVTLHYAVGCLPEHVLYSKETTNNETSSGPTSASSTIDGESDPPSCPVVISPDHENFKKLLKHHSKLSRNYLAMMKSNGTTLELKTHLLHNLEEIIAWGKQYKVGLALHDTPYPMLLPEILKIVQKYHGLKPLPVVGALSKNNGTDLFLSNDTTASYQYKSIKVKPITLLSERDAGTFVKRRTKNHGMYTWICRPPMKDSMDLTANNASDTFTTKRPFVFTKMNTTNLRGGAFDVIGCIDNANMLDFSSSNWTNRPIHLDQLFYTFAKANRLRHQNYLIRTMKNYQEAVRNVAVFSYDIFQQENRTTASDLASWIKRAMIDALIEEDGQINMEGADFLGFDSFFKTNQFEVEVRRGHRRRHHGESYGEIGSEPVADVAHPRTSHSTMSISSSKMNRFHIFTMQHMGSLVDDIMCGDNH